MAFRVAPSSRQGKRSEMPLVSSAALLERNPTARKLYQPAGLGSGHPLTQAQKHYFEPKLNADFSAVRLHTDDTAAGLAKAMSAQAYTLGEHVILGRETPPLSGRSGHEFLAHELAHVVQHRRNTSTSAVGIHAAETEASQAAQRVASGQSASIQTAAPRGVPMRQSLEAASGRFQLQTPSLGDALGRSRSRITSHPVTYTLSNFKTDSPDLTSDHVDSLEQIADNLNQRPLIFGGFVTITGFADRRGTDEHNRALGQARADRVKARLSGLVTDEATRREIRAYSLGEPDEGPEGDIPALRKVTVTITRRSYNAVLAPTPGLSLNPRLPSAEQGEGSGVSPDPDSSTAPPTPDVGLPPNLRVPLPNLPPTTRPQQLPPEFWRSLPPVPPSESRIRQVSRWLTGRLGRRDLARVAGDIASVFGLNRDRVRSQLDDAMISGGEAAVKALIRAMIEAVAGPPTSRPPRIPGEIPPPTIFKLPPIRF